MWPDYLSWDRSLPAKEVRLLTLVPWLHGKSWCDTGQPQEMEQVNSLHFPCCVRTPSSIPCFPQGFLSSAGGWWTPLVQGVSTGGRVSMHSISTARQALHFCWEGRKEKLPPFLHPQGVWWVLFALSWPHRPSFLPNSHRFFPLRHTHLRTPVPLPERGTVHLRSRWGVFLLVSRRFPRKGL